MEEALSSAGFDLERVTEDGLLMSSFGRGKGVRGFYELSAKEKVSDSKAIVAVELSTLRVLLDDEARKVLKFRASAAAPVEGYRVWIESTSANRKLKHDTTVLFRAAKKARKEEKKEKSAASVLPTLFDWHALASVHEMEEAANASEASYLLHRNDDATDFTERTVSRAFANPALQRLRTALAATTDDGLEWRSVHKADAPNVTCFESDTMRLICVSHTIEGDDIRIAGFEEPHADFVIVVGNQQQIPFIECKTFFMYGTSDVENDVSDENTPEQLLQELISNLERNSG